MIASLNGQLIPLEEATVPVWDYGFTMGVAVTEQLRTFRGKLHQLQPHLQRLEYGLSVTGIELGFSIEEIGAIATEIAQKNYDEPPSNSDLSVSICVTPGPHTVRAPDSIETNRATVLIYALPLDYSWSQCYQTGVKLSTVQVREIPESCLPHGLKCRSRIHYFLADQQAEQKQPGSKALLLNIDGSVAESTASSIVMVRDRTIIAPPCDQVLPGVSFQYIEHELAGNLNLSIDRQVISLDDMKTADEILALSTSFCILPVTELDGTPVGSGQPGKIFDDLIREWSNRVGVGIVAQGRIEN